MHNFERERHRSDYPTYERWINVDPGGADGGIHGEYSPEAFPHRLAVAAEMAEVAVQGEIRKGEE